MTETIPAGFIPAFVELAIPNPPSRSDVPVALTATVRTVDGGAPSGSVTFLAGSTVLGEVPVVSTGEYPSVESQETLTTTLPAGTDNLLARYSGNATYTSADSPVVTVIVRPASSRRAARHFR